jgi:hypothetical protein
MTKMQGGTTMEQPPKISGQETRTALLDRAIRKVVPLRKAFVQAPRGAESRRGPLREFVRTGDLRGLRAYLMVVAACSNGTNGWTTTHDSMVWARLLDTVAAAEDQSARTGAWRVLKRLEKDRKLIRCSRTPGSTKITVTLLLEDGSEQDYTHPAQGTGEANRYLRIPTLFWAKGYDTRVDLPGLAMLLVIAREKPWSEFPAERAPEWYGWSADTHLRGLKKLLELGLVERRNVYRKTPLSPTGSTLVYQYRLSSVMRPRKQKNVPVADKAKRSDGSES